MFKKNQFLNFIGVIALLVLSACASQPSSLATLPVASATQPVSTPVIADTPTPEPILTETPAQEPPTPLPTSASSLCTEPVALSASGETIAYKHVQFNVPQGLGLSFTVQECQSGIWDEGYGPNYPAHLLFKAVSPLSNNHIQPEIRVFEIPADLQAYTYPINSLDQLRQLLVDRPEPSPWYNGVANHTGEKYIDSLSASGVRGIVEYSQDIFFWTNNYVQYVYNGLTADGRYFISANFPLNAPFLMDIQSSDPLTNTNPNAIPISGWSADFTQAGKIIEEYNQEALRRFSESSPTDFTPSLDLYDQLVASFTVSQ